MRYSKTFLFAALMLGVSTATSLIAAPLGTVFNYQGRLDQNNQSAPNGIYQMTFWLWAASGGGNPLASNTVPTIPVTNGLFVADVDFGAAAFTGEERWLGITVRTNNGALPFTLLTSRTRIAPTPNAVYAGTAGTATNVVSGAVVKSLNGLRDNVSLVAGPNITLTPNGNALTVASTAGPGVWSLNGANTYYNGGNVGIGTINPQAKLEVITANGNAVAGYSASSADSGVYGENNGQGYGVAGRTTGTGVAVYGDNRNPAGWAGIFAGNVLVDSGDIRMSAQRTIISDGRLHIQANESLYLNPFAGAGDVIVGGGGGPGNLHVVGSASWGTSLLNQDQGGAIELGNSLGNGNSPYLDFHYGVGVDQDYNVRLINDANGQLTCSGSISVCSLTIRGGCDLAEPFPMEEQIDKGSVVIIDEEHPGRLKMSTRAYDTQVAGIVSGANGINAGIALKQEGALDQGQNVALTGRVYVKADAAHGAIKPGDLLTTSDTPGHAMKVSDHTKSQGAILGKAMSALREGTGLVLVLVTLQ